LVFPERRTTPLLTEAAAVGVDVGAVDAEAVRREEGDLRFRGDPGVLDVRASGARAHHHH
jgi:hypothetical protein